MRISLKCYLTTENFVSSCTIALLLAMALRGSSFGDQQTKFLLICPMLIITIVAITNKGILNFRIEWLYIYLFIFCVFSLLSSFWALSPSLAIQAGKHLIYTLYCIFALSLYYSNRHSIDSLLKSLMFCGYILLIIVFILYGSNFIGAMLRMGARMRTDYINPNTVGVYVSNSILINIYYIIYKKEIRIWSLFLLPAFLIIAFAGSKKSVLILIIGMLMLIELYILRKEDTSKRIVKTFALIGVILLLLFLLSSLPMFALLVKRITILFDTFSGKVSNGSTAERLEMIQYGFLLFKEHFLVGIDMNNSWVYKYGMYLHNNYIELLADGGIIGFICYYIIYIHVLFLLIKNQDKYNDEYCICIVSIITNMIIELGMIQYDSKTIYVYFLMYYIEARILRLNKHNRMFSKTRKCKSVNV